jgi:ankyrin repeat protein
MNKISNFLLDVFQILILFIFIGQTEIVNMLLTKCKGINIDAKNNLGFTPLMKAALQGRTKTAKLLLFAGKYEKEISSLIIFIFLFLIFYLLHRFFFSFVSRCESHNLLSHQLFFFLFKIEIMFVSNDRSIANSNRSC